MKNDRLMAILLILLDKRKTTAPELARLLEVSTRTIYRDLNTLTLSGIPIISEQGVNGGISIYENFKVNNKTFSNDELENLLLAINNIPYTNKKTIELLKSKLKTLLPKDMENNIKNKSKQIVIDFKTWDGNEISKRKIEIIKNALNQNKVITFNYQSFNNSITSRKVEPSRIILKGAYWYLQGFCLERQSFRTFKISRIEDLLITNEIFSLRKLDNYNHEIKSWTDSNTIMLELLISKTIKEELINLYGPSVIKKSIDDKYLATIPFNQTQIEYRYIIGFGKEATILNPENIKIEFINYLKDLLASYN